MMLCSGILGDVMQCNSCRPGDDVVQYAAAVNSVKALQNRFTLP